jgi:hypothetical protein
VHRYAVKCATCQSFKMEANRQWCRSAKVSMRIRHLGSQTIADPCGSGFWSDFAVNKRNSTLKNILHLGTSHKTYITIRGYKIKAFLKGCMLILVKIFCSWIRKCIPNTDPYEHNQCRSMQIRIHNILTF